MTEAYRWAKNVFPMGLQLTAYSASETAYAAGTDTKPGTPNTWHIYAGNQPAAGYGVGLSDISVDGTINLWPSVPCGQSQWSYGRYINMKYYGTDTNGLRGGFSMYAVRAGATGTGTDNWPDVRWDQLAYVDKTAILGMTYYCGGGTSVSHGDFLVQVYNAHLAPYADNTLQCGTSAYRWSVVYAANGTIQTSDARLKKDITPIPDASCEAFVRAVTPVTGKWKKGSSKVVTDLEPDVGQAQRKVIGTHLEEVPDPGRHNWFTAQNVRAAMQAVNAAAGSNVIANGLIDKCADDSDDKPSLSLRYAELIPLLAGALRSALSKIDLLEARVVALENRS